MLYSKPKPFFRHVRTQSSTKCDAASQTTTGGFSQIKTEPNEELNKLLKEIDFGHLQIRKPPGSSHQS